MRSGHSLWMMEPSALADMRLLLHRLASGERVSAVNTQREPSPKAKAVAVIPVVGVMEQRQNVWSDFYGGISTDGISRAFDSALNDSAVKAVLLDMHTPGGEVYGVPELSRKVHAARGTKPVVAVANSLAASAGYYLASAADRVYVTPSGDVGSVGVYMMHLDHSKMLDEVGIKPTFVKAPAHKAEGNPYEPLSDEAREYLQGEVNELYDMFVSDVAKFRGVSGSDVRQNFGEGRTLTAKRAVSAGMADGVATFDQVVNRLLSGKIRFGEPASADDWTTPVVAEDELRLRQRRARVAVAVRNRG